MFAIISGSLFLLTVAVGFAVRVFPQRSRDNVGSQDTAEQTSKPLRRHYGFWIYVVVGAAVWWLGFELEGEAENRGNFFFSWVGFVSAVFVYGVAREWGWWWRLQRADQHGDIDKIVVMFQKRMNRRGESAAMYYWLGYCLSRHDCWDEALEAFEEAERLDPSHPLCMANKALALWRVGRTDEALALMVQVQQDLPNEIVLSTNICQILAERDEWKESEDQFDRARCLFEQQQESLSEPQRHMLEGELQKCRTLLDGDATAAMPE